MSYGRKVINTITKKIGVSSPDVMSKIFLFGLYRDRKPFNSLSGDINKLQSIEELNTLTESWKRGMVTEMTKKYEFLDNEPLASKYIDAYISNIYFSDVREKININNLFDTLISPYGVFIDAKPQLISIKNPLPNDIIFEDEEVLIVIADNKFSATCYGKNEKWCISQPASSHFYTYRINYNATIYFVYLKKYSPKNANKQLVILKYKTLPEEFYGVANRTNSGTCVGSSNECYSWQQITNKIPELHDKEKYFKYIELTDKEVKYYKIVSQEIRENDLQEYINSVCEQLKHEGIIVTPKDFIRDYYLIKGKINTAQLSTLNDELIDELIENRYFFDDSCFKVQLTERQKRRYVVVLANNNDTISEYQYKYASKKILINNILLNNGYKIWSYNHSGIDSISYRDFVIDFIKKYDLDVDANEIVFTSIKKYMMLLSEENESISNMENIDLDTYMFLDKKQKKELLMHGLHTTHLLQKFDKDDIDLFLNCGQLNFRGALSFEEIEKFKNDDKLRETLPIFVSQAIKNGYEIKNGYLFSIMDEPEKIDYYTSILKNMVVLEDNLKIEHKYLKSLPSDLLCNYFDSYAGESDILTDAELDALNLNEKNITYYVRFIERMGSKGKLNMENYSKFKNVLYNDNHNNLLSSNTLSSIIRWLPYDDFEKLLISITKGIFKSGGTNYSIIPSLCVMFANINKTKVGDKIIFIKNTLDYVDSYTALYSKMSADNLPNINLIGKDVYEYLSSRVNNTKI